ncbi:GNAT family N-acetyltransferase [Rouxiella badensis]|uniref:GNAT family N-acetyltransferase n=1 Tax=Rouxiella badensis TaxID=1646377 RepID=UPI001787A493|nr:GNAT family N-acetyltransferase [Rouxiella badensis]QOI57363.1 GNAT family N-acetyltransferase [Rouxiella badensis subsp. acadiensis]
MLNAAPQIETPRLILRGHTVDDFNVIAALWADPEIVRFIGGTPSTREASWTRLLRYVGHWQLLGFGYWVVKEKESGRFIGEIGLADFQRNMQPSLENKAEMGWVLSPEFHGKGYASEAAKAVLDWAAAHLERPVCCIIAPENTPSIRLAEKHGFIHQIDTTYQDSPVRLYSRPGTEK